jgi:hypothetical protein
MRAVVIGDIDSESRLERRGLTATVVVVVLPFAAAAAPSTSGGGGLWSTYAADAVHALQPI